MDRKDEVSKSNIKIFIINISTACLMGSGMISNHMKWFQTVEAHQEQNKSILNHSYVVSTFEFKKVINNFENTC